MLFNLLKDNFINPMGQRYFADPGGGGAGSGGSGGQGGSGGNPPDKDPTLSDVNLDALSKLPEEDRKAVLAAVTTKVKNLQAIGTKKSEEYASKLEALQDKLADAKVVEDIRANPELSKAIEKTIDDFKTGKLSSKSDTGDIFDKWIENASTPQEAKNLEALRDKIDKSGKSANEKITLLEKQIAILNSTTQSIHTDRATRGVNHLKNTFGDEVIDKYNSQLSAWMTKYPQKTGESIEKYTRSALVEVATPEDVDTAFLNKAQLKEKRETQRRIDGSEPGGAGETGKDVEIPRDKKSGKVNIAQFAKNLVSTHKLGKNL